MGILDSIKGKLGSGSEEPEPPRSRMRQPPGREAPPGPEGPAPEPGEPGPGQAPPGPEPPEAPPVDSPPSRNPDRRDTPDRPGAGRGGKGSTLDVDRNQGRPPAGGEDLDFEPAGGAGPGSGRDRNTEPSRRGREPRERGGRGVQGDDMPENPRDYNLDLPEPGGEGDRLDHIEDQNERIIDLLEDIRDSVGGGGRRPR